MTSIRYKIIGTLARWVRVPIILIDPSENPPHLYDVGKEFSANLGPPRGCGFSGEALRAIILEKLEKYHRIRIDMRISNRYGISCAFLKEVFGRLRDQGYQAYELLDRIEIECSDPSDIHLIGMYIHGPLLEGKDIVKEIGVRHYISNWRPIAWGS